MARPKCGQCVKVKVECPGYRHQVDILLRDQTAAVTKRYEKKRPASLGKEPKPATTSETNLPRQVAPSLESYALGFLFSDVVLRPARDWGTSHGHFDFLVQLHTNSSCDSALAAVTTWLGVTLLGTNVQGEPFRQENALLSQAITKVSATLSDPVLCLNDDILAAVMMLQHGNHFRDLRYKHCMPSRVHQHGAEALIKKRGPLNFKNAVARTLYAAVRYNAVDFAFLTGELGMNWAMWDQSKICLQEDDPIISRPAMQLDSYAVLLLTIKKEIEEARWTNNSLQSVSLEARLLDLLNELSLWEKNLPIGWTPYVSSRFTHHHATEDTAYVFGQRYLIELGTRLFLRKLNISKHNIHDSYYHVEGIDAIFNAIDNIIASEKSLVGRSDNPPLESDWISSFTTPMQADKFPSVTIDQCLATGMGSRLLAQTLDALHCVLSRFRNQLRLPESVVAALHERIMWVKQEQQTLSLAYPPKDF